MQSVVAGARNLNASKSQNLEEFITVFEDIFAMMGNDYGCKDRVSHWLDRGDNCPIR
jgi:hypothetical protein